jgi:hypothetical protein
MVKIKVNFAGYEYTVNETITIKNITFDVTKANEEIIDNHGELARLYLDVLPIPKRVVMNSGIEIVIPKKKGIDLETCSISEMKKYLNDDKIKKSNSIINLIKRIIYLKDSSYTNSEDLKLYNKKTKNIDFLGETGFSKTSLKV